MARVAVWRFKRTMTALGLCCSLSYWACLLDGSVSCVQCTRLPSRRLGSSCSFASCRFGSVTSQNVKRCRGLILSLCSTYFMTGRLEHILAVLEAVTYESLMKCHVAAHHVSAVSLKRVMHRDCLDVRLAHVVDFPGEVDEVFLSAAAGPSPTETAHQ